MKHRSQSQIDGETLTIFISSVIVARNLYVKMRNLHAAFITYLKPPQALSSLPSTDGE